MGILEILKKRPIFYDGATGTYLQKNGLKTGDLPELMNINNKETLINMHKEFIEAGSDIILANTFGANSLKFDDETLEEVIKCAIENAKTARDVCKKDVYISYDLGPSGKLLKPMGDLSFEKAYEIFKQQAILAKKYGADLITIETMTDLYEVKSAVLAVKENCDLPLFVTTSFDLDGKLLTGADVKTVVATLEGLGVDALGTNCGMGPYQMEAVVDDLIKYSSLPIIVTPNAGLPREENGEYVYDIDHHQFAEKMLEFNEKGVHILGGCCGTTYDHISKMTSLCKKANPIIEKEYTFVTSYAKCVELSDDPVIIGERINPTGKPRFRKALKENNIDYILQEGITQQEKNAHILDVNVGLPDIDEAKVMENAVFEIQSVINLPLQIDTSSVEALESGLRIYNGKPMVNSVNGKKESMEKIFPLIKKYGGVLVGLTLDEDGIPETAQKRYEIAEKIVKTAEKYGIHRKNIVIDPLAMTISSDSNSANVTLEALRLIRTNLKVNTVLGVSNISFGLPNREKINSNFFTLAMHSGLTSGIINPSSKAMMDSFYSYRALKGFDESSLEYIEKNSEIEVIQEKPTEISLIYTIQKGLREQIAEQTKHFLKTESPMDIINNHLIEALNIVGQKFEKGEIFLPQLLISAETAKIAFEVVKKEIEKKDIKQDKKGTIILATVKGDIHDIGKNIVKVLLENYGYDIIDLGKDVAPEIIIDRAKKDDIKLIGLSALMTTTVVSMKETIELAKAEGLDCKFMVGGAVLTKDYAEMINADFYGKDALSSVQYANLLF